MKIRIKFSKTGSLRFIGHLDVMRFFQKLNRRADIDVAYSQGYSPHQLMSFSSPLSLGHSSDAEYVDMVLLSCPEKAELLRRMNAKSVPELRILDARILPDDAKNAMSLLFAADYLLTFAEGKEPADPDLFYEELQSFLDRDVIEVTKKTKKNEKAENIKPSVLEYRRLPGNAIFLKLRAGSKDHLKPELLMEAFYEAAGRTWDPYLFMVSREEQYGGDFEKLVPLLDYGKDF